MNSTSYSPFVYEVDTDPSTGTGLTAPIGSFAVLNTGGSAWQKTGSSDTAWNVIGIIAVSTATANSLTANSTSTEGSTTNFARADHTHAIASGTVSTQTPNQTNAAGTSANFARADHAHNIPTGTPSALTPNAGNSQGSASAFAQQDHIHNVPTAAPANQTIAASASDGSASTFSRADHLHTFSTAAPSTQNADQSNTAGTSTSFARADHIHNIPTATPSNIGSANAQGSATTFVKSDHVHQGVHSLTVNSGSQRYGDQNLKDGYGIHIADDGVGNLTYDTLYGPNEFAIVSTSGLVINYTGGRFFNGLSGSVYNVPSGSITVGANQNPGYFYIALNLLSSAPTVTASTTPPSVDSIPIASYISGASSISSTTDIRTFVDFQPLGHILRVTYPGTGLTVNVNAGRVRINGTITNVADSTLVLTANTASGAIYVDTNGTLTANTTGTFPSNSVPLALYTTNASAVTALTSVRAFLNNNVVFGSSSDIQNLTPNLAASAGSTNRYADAAHIHNVPTAAPANQTIAASASDGSASTFSRADHLHTFSTASAVTISSNANITGTSTSFARADHTHELTATSALLDHVPQYDGSNWQAIYPEVLWDQSHATVLKEDFLGSLTGAYNWLNTLSGGGSIITVQSTAPQDSSHPGVLAITGGNAAARYSNLTLLGVYDLGGGAMSITILFQLATTTNAQFRLGLGDLSTNADYNNGVYLEYNSGTSANWLIKTASGGTRTSTTTSVAATASAWHKLVISINAAASSVSYTLDGTSLGSITTNIPTVSIGPVLLANSLGATTTTLYVDYYTLTQRFTSAR